MNAPVLLEKAPPASTLSDGALVHLPLDSIAVQDGFNPRRFFEETEFAALVDSVCRQGVLQAVWVRPQADFDPRAPRFWLIAGERRWRAARAAGLTTLPALIRDVDQRQALALADLENNPALRIGLSVAEEARFAQRFVAECDGDREEAARWLGWTRGKLDARLLLLHATPAVLDALTQRQIKTGHAELLAGLPPATQDGTLAKILSDAISVVDLKTRIKSFALELSTAVFDKTDCTICPHNSSLQGALFGEAIEDGRCQNRACFAQKTQAALKDRQTELTGEYATVFLDTERPADTYAVLTKTGPQGVGEAQFTACQGCPHFAAMLSSQPGREGVVQAPLCVNLACHREKIAAAHPLAAPGVSAPTATAPRPAGDAPPAVPTRPTPPTGTAPKKVAAWVDDWLRRQAAEAVAANPDLLRAWLLAALYRDAGQPEALLTARGLDAKITRSRATLIPALAALNPAQKQDLLIALTRYQIQDRPLETDRPALEETVRAAEASLATAHLDPVAAFTPDVVFWQAHTKAGIESLLRQAKNPQGETFAAWYAREHRASATDAKAFERLIKGKTAGLIAALDATSFDFSAWLPAVIAQRFSR